MTAALAAGCGVAGLVVGAAILIGIEHIPSRASLLSPPFPEVGAGIRRPRGALVVLGTGALWAGLALHLGDAWELPAYLVLSAALVLLSAIDLDHHLLPNRVVYPTTLVVLALFGVAAALDDAGDAFLTALACGAGAFVVFFVLHLISPRGMGFGDVKLSFVLGLALGWLGAGEAVLGLFLGFVYGAVVGIALLVTGVRSRKDAVPFGPFLAAGTMTAVFVGSTI
ncbi:MAG TPA: A24 family peptidase, partial [Acidimicrobiia bacterium]|nr:A24 family peptidase [Acidimicrobiia bacterium]